MENCKKSGKSQGLLRWMISGNPAYECNATSDWITSKICDSIICNILSQNRHLASHRLTCFMLLTGLALWCNVVNLQT